jgi:hypothetical protein
MSDADEFGLLAAGYEGLPVLKNDRARRLEARYTDANEFINKMRRSASLPRFGMNLRLRLAHHVCGIMLPHTSAHRYLQGWGEFRVTRRLRGNAKVAKRAEGGRQ